MPELKRLKIPIFRLGKWKHPAYGTIEGTQEKFNQMMDNFRKNVLGRPPFARLGHDKDNGPTFGATPAEAWVSDLVQEGNVLYALAWPTNTEFVEAVRNKRYRFASPEYEPDYTDKETGAKVGPVLTAIGMTNEPFLTRLPDAVALADLPETIYLDHEEVKEQMPDDKLMQENNTLLKKLADGLNKLFESVKTPGQSGLTDDERKKLAEIDDLKVKLAATQTDLKTAQEKLSQTELSSWVTQVDARLNTLVASGVPPAMCQQAKAVLLANPAAATTMIKLADDKEISLAEQIYATLDALPKEHRVRLGQGGAQTSAQPGELSAKDCYGEIVPELNK